MGRQRPVACSDCGQMKAVLCRSFGPPPELAVETVASPRPGAGEVRIGIHACGVSFPDTLIVEGRYQFRPDPPFSPGAEAAGEILEVAPGVTEYAVGDRVVRFGTHGGFAEELVAPVAELVPLPAELSYRTAAAVPLNYGTAYHALVQRARLAPGETVLVLGAGGGIGLAAVEVAKALGAVVIAAASDAAKLEAASASGADALIDYTQEPLKERAKALAVSGAVDVVFDPVGGGLAEEALRTLAVAGRHLVIGFASGEIPRFPANLPLLKECQIVGVFWGAFAAREPHTNRHNLDQVLSWCAQGRIRPTLFAEYTLAQAAAALDDIRARRVIGKSILVTERGAAGSAAG